MNNPYYQAILEIVKTGHWITDQVTQELKPYGISEPQYNVLRILRGRKGKPITVFEIQGKMIQRTSNVTRLVDKLLKKQLVERKECPTNRRKMDITITKEGLTLLRKMDQKLEAFHAPMLQNLEQEDAYKLVELINKLKEG